MSLEIVRAQEAQHYREAALLHSEGITEGFLSSLGAPFLSILYAGINQAPDSGVFLAIEQKEILGFISCAKDVKTCYKDVLKKKWTSLSFAMVPNLLNLQVYKKITETLLYPVKHGGEGETSPDQKGARRPELLSMAVSSAARGKGVGKALVSRLDEEMTRFKVPGYFVVTYAKDQRSNSFYQSCGFNLMRDFRSHGKPMKEYFKTL